MCSLRYLSVVSYIFVGTQSTQVCLKFAFTTSGSLPNSSSKDKQSQQQPKWSRAFEGSACHA